MLYHKRKFLIESFLLEPTCFYGKIGKVVVENRVLDLRLCMHCGLQAEIATMQRRQLRWPKKVFAI